MRIEVAAQLKNQVNRLTVKKLDQQVKRYVCRSKVESTDQKCDQHIKSWISREKDVDNRSKARSTDQKLDQQIKS